MRKLHKLEIHDNNAENGKVSFQLTKVRTAMIVCEHKVLINVAFVTKFQGFRMSRYDTIKLTKILQKSRK